MADDGSGGGAVLGAICGAVVVGVTKFLDYRKAKRERESQDAVITRQEYRSDNERLTARNDQLCEELEELRGEFWKQRDEVTILRAEHKDCLRRERELQQQIERMQAENNWMRGEVDRLRADVNELRKNR